MADIISETEAADAGKAAARAHAVQRLQIGFFGLGGMILLIGLANIIMNQALVSEATMVPEAAPTVTPQATPSPASDPLADAGVGPDLPSEPVQQQAPAPAPTNAPQTNAN
ncbi:hypothetical protein GRI89_00570 [Altererythrobacter salegens]|uniref:Uncharacterized protein n=1 Tax=Croceibacterium salegens TaxID=1737568 RepID=A0A6I4SRK0_9SPHN|nr:hypothetical protein [Croceibacterium salegens]MXO58038.1 hypothetical protein [Croceibacterium salegens]